MDEKKDPNKLDRSREYGVTFGHPNIGFNQDGKDFDHSGKIYVTPDNKAPEKPEDIPRDTLKLRTDRLKQAWQQKVGQE